MKITIDEKIVEQKGLSIEEFLLLLFLKVSDRPHSEVFEQIVKDGKVYYNNEAMQTLLMDNTDDLVQTILLDSEKTVPEIEREEVPAGRGHRPAAGPARPHHQRTGRRGLVLRGIGGG